MSEKHTPSSEKQTTQKDLTTVYDRMLERVRELWEENPGREPLEKFIATAREKAIELGEVSREEAERIGDYIRRDIEDAASFLKNEKTREFVDWLRLDVTMIEQRLLELFSSVADRTRLELIELQERVRHANEYHTGEITSIGTLYCSDCGKSVHFHRTSHIPPCPSCHGTHFVRRRPNARNSA